MGKNSETVAALREFAANSASRLGPHPEPEELFAYQERQLAGEDAERIRDHLSLCSSCAHLVLDLASFPTVKPLRQRRISRATVDRQWQAIRDVLNLDTVPQARPTSQVRWPAWLIPLGAPGFSRFLAAATAVLLAANLGLAFWVRSLQHRLAESSRLEVYAHLVDLVPVEGSSVRDRDARDAMVDTQVPAWADRLVLLLNLFDARDFPTYRVEILTGPEGQPSQLWWSSQELRRAPAGNFVLDLPRNFLPAGNYRIELWGLVGEQRTRLAEYVVALDFDSK